MVWEEVIILLPPRVQMVFLSATTPNALEFCDWIGRTKSRRVFVCGTTKRPVPLQHFMLHRDEVAPLMLADGACPSLCAAAAARCPLLRLPFLLLVSRAV